jgi:predicted MPP superfamily phosphohydrolase
LHFNHNGTFKILQVADLHFSVSEGQCRDLDVALLPTELGFDSTKSPCRGDVLTQSLIKQTLQAEKPDLVIFTGDQLNGQTTTWDAYSVLVKFVGQIIAAKIPWTVVFGNHDDESDMNRREQMAMLKSLPYAVQEMEEGPGFVDGVGNYVIKVRSADP